MRALDLAMRIDDPNVVVLPTLPSAAAVPILADVAPAENEVVTDESRRRSMRAATWTLKRWRGG